MEELLQQILSEIQGMKSDIHGMKSEMHGMKSEIQGMKSEIQGMKSEIHGIKNDVSRLERKIDGIYQSVVRLEEGQPLDIFALLESINNKLDTKDSEIAVLNKRVFKVESELERLNRQ